MTTKDTLKSNIADTLYTHDWLFTKCQCGWEPTAEDDHVDHQVEALLEVFDIKRRID